MAGRKPQSYEQRRSVLEPDVLGVQAAPPGAKVAFLKDIDGTSSSDGFSTATAYAGWC
jgi:hypothetical protein